MNLSRFDLYFMDHPLLTPAIRAAERGTEILADSRYTNESESTKGDPDVGHHAIVTKADIATQESIIGYLRSVVPQSYFITEEKGEAGKERILTRGIGKENNIVFGIDPLDGTAQFNRGLYEFSVSIGLMENGVHTGGVIAAPAIRRGFAVAGHRNHGVVTILDNETADLSFRMRNAIKERPRKDSIVYVGPDMFFLKQFGPFMQRFSSEVRTTSCTGSCAVGLALLAAGRIDALVEPVQSPWDWFAGYPLVLEAGGKIQFFHYREGEIVGFEKPDDLSYHTAHRNTAFIAGNPAIVDWLFELLHKEWVPEKKK